MDKITTCFKRMRKNNELNNILQHLLKLIVKDPINTCREFVDGQPVADVLLFRHDSLVPVGMVLAYCVTGK